MIAALLGPLSYAFCTMQQDAIKELLLPVGEPGLAGPQHAIATYSQERDAYARLLETAGDSAATAAVEEAAAAAALALQEAAADSSYTTSVAPPTAGVMGSVAKPSLQASSQRPIPPTPLPPGASKMLLGTASMRRLPGVPAPATSSYTSSSKAAFGVATGVTRQRSNSDDQSRGRSSSASQKAAVDTTQQADKQLGRTSIAESVGSGPLATPFRGATTARAVVSSPLPSYLHVAARPMIRRSTHAAAVGAADTASSLEEVEAFYAGSLVFIAINPPRLDPSSPDQAQRQQSSAAAARILVVSTRLAEQALDHVKLLGKNLVALSDATAHVRAICAQAVNDDITASPDAALAVPAANTGPLSMQAASQWQQQLNRRRQTRVREAVKLALERDRDFVPLLTKFRAATTLTLPQDALLQVGGV